MVNQPVCAMSEYTTKSGAGSRFRADSRAQTNVLLVKDDVGTAKPFTRPLPTHKQFMYGEAILHDKEHAPVGKLTITIVTSLEQASVLTGKQFFQNFF